MEVLKEDNNAIGRDRSAVEQWVVSPPNIKPCDVSNTGNIQYWQRRNHPLQRLTFPWCRNTMQIFITIASIAEARVCIYREHKRTQQQAIHLQISCLQSLRESKEEIGSLSADQNMRRALSNL
jgi:hypothetical protein